MRTMIYTMAAGLALGLAAPAAAGAQGRIGDRIGDRAQDARARGTVVERGRAGERQDDRRDARRDERGGDRMGGRQQAGPPFCANGRGHPVFGMRWCRERGFATGVSWQRAPWGDVRLSQPQRAGRGDVGRAVLVDILGQGTYGRVDAHRRMLGLTDPLAGRWERQRDGTAVLRLHAGGIPVAEFIDRGTNGRAEVVRINAGR
jgi:hypothetical protein